MKPYNVIVILNPECTKVLLCKRTKEPYQGLYNFIGGKIENEKEGFQEAYRELYEETHIGKEDVSLKHFMNLEYLSFGKRMEVYYGVLKHDVELVEEINPLEWVSLDEDFFDMTKYAGEGNIGHILKEIQIYINH